MYVHICSTLQHIATHCNTLQHTATHCKLLPHIETHCHTLQLTTTHFNHTTAHQIHIEFVASLQKSLLQTRCNTLQHNATNCNTLQHTSTHYNRLQRTRYQWRLSHVCINHIHNTLQHTATHCNTLHNGATQLHNIATHCNTLQHTATHCNIVQHAVTQYKTLKLTRHKRSPSHNNINHICALVTCDACKFHELNASYKPHELNTTSTQSQTQWVFYIITNLVTFLLLPRVTPEYFTNSMSHISLTNSTRHLHNHELNEVSTKFKIESLLCACIKRRLNVSWAQSVM